MRRLAQVACSTWTGLALLGLIVVYLGGVSVWTEEAARFLRVEPEGVYRHWLLVAMAGLLCANLLIATAARVPWRPASAGAWISHLGVLALAAGTAVYAMNGVSGYCEAWRVAPDQAKHLSAATWPAASWTPIHRFYREEDLRGPPGDADELPSIPLPAAVQITRAEYVPQEGSPLPKDFLCEVRVTWPDGRVESNLAVSLNHPLRVGPYQISQSSWYPSPQRPMRIVLAVRSRPGLPMIWLGMGLMIAGMLFAFYVKPLILRKGDRLLFASRAVAGDSGGGALPPCTTSMSEAKSCLSPFPSEGGPA